MTEPTQQAATRPLLYGALAVLIAAGTAAGAWRVVRGYQVALDAARNPADSVEVVAAARDVPAGTVLTAADLKVARIASADATAGSVFTDTTVVVGETAVERLMSGEPVRRERLTLGSGLPRPETMLEPGTRAVTVRVDRAAGVGGLVSAGAYVDVIVTIRPDANALGANWVTETIIQAVRVLAVGETTVATPNETAKGVASRDKAAARPRDVYATLEVEPEEAEKLAMATSRGDLYLSLRPRDDFELSFNETPLVTNALVGISAAPSPERASRLEKRKVAITAAAPTTRPLEPATEVISGADRSVEHFDVNTGRRVETEKRK